MAPDADDLSQDPGPRTRPVKSAPAVHNSYAYFIIIGVIFLGMLVVLISRDELITLPVLWIVFSSYFMSLTLNYIVLPNFCCLNLC